MAPGDYHSAVPHWMGLLKNRALDIGAGGLSLGAGHHGSGAVWEAGRSQRPLSELEVWAV